jgi:Rieske Fe-S protein
MDQSRRKLLKLLAVTPLYLTFGLAGTALMRFAKPSMSPLGVFDPADVPVSATKESFQLSDFPKPWTCIPFVYQMKITLFSPEKEEIRKIPGYVIRTQTDEIVAYSRICPKGGCILNYLPNGVQNCGCAKEDKNCCCARNAPALICPSAHTVFDLSSEQVIGGSSWRPPRKFELDVQHDYVSIVRLESSAIV